MRRCDCCGAPLHGNRCDYCGAEEAVSAEPIKKRSGIPRDITGAFCNDADATQNSDPLIPDFGIDNNDGCIETRENASVDGAVVVFIRALVFLGGFATFFYAFAQCEKLAGIEQMIVSGFWKIPCFAQWYPYLIAGERMIATLGIILSASAVFAALFVFLSAVMCFLAISRDDYDTMHRWICLIAFSTVHLVMWFVVECVLKIV